MKNKLKPHKWIVDEKTMTELRKNSKHVMGFYICKNCDATCCDGLDIDYNAPECTGKKKNEK